ncbi:MAG: hypothetical protein F4Y47_17505 [Acidobacteriia bacterium]|nr:hypothetical protein [Terriglobia bacterium]MYG03512.1 hypothetical protein [Terriglobia bacterium]MYK09694.1 hypothetical protein [Terriglobia bacterium]
MAHPFQENSLFALIAVSDAYTDLPEGHFQLSDGTWILPHIPVADNHGIWEEWLGSIRLKHLTEANLVLLVEKPSDTPHFFGDEYLRLSHHLGRLFYLLHLGFGIDVSEDAADRLTGFSVNGAPDIKSVEYMPRFYRTQGSSSIPIAQDWLEDSLVLRSGYGEMASDKTQFRRIIRGLDTLFKGKKEESGQDRLHQFVRALEALVLPKQGKSKKQFVRRCQTFADVGDDAHALFSEAYDLRSATEHLNRWDKAVMSYRKGEREAICLQRTLQMERLACDAYSRLLRKPALRDHFRTDDAIAEFWKLPNSQRCELWGTRLDLTIAEQS